MDEKAVKIDCSFCGKEIECPPNMLDSDKHACYECFEKLGERSEKDLGRVHVDIPPDKFMSNSVVSAIMEDTFNRVWKDFKSESKDMSKKEIAQEMFHVGAQGMFQFLMENMKKLEKEKKTGGEKQ